MSWLKSLRAIVGSLEGCGTNSRNARQILFALLEKYCAAAKICTRAKIAEVVKLTWPRKTTIYPDSYDLSGNNKMYHSKGQMENIREL